MEKSFWQNKEIPVQGISWMDHEFGSTQLREYQVGWDWFSLQLDKGMELMFYQIRQRMVESTPIRADHHLPRWNLSPPSQQRVPD